jgi:carboxymethylenebutenolidase
MRAWQFGTAVTQADGLSSRRKERLMCDDHTDADNARHLSRRQFTAMAAATAMAGFSARAAAGELVEQDVRITTPDGVCDAYFVHPAVKKKKDRVPGVLIWPDILGLRPAFRAMGKRLAGEGYAVLVVNPFYRAREAPVVGEGAVFSNPEVRNVVVPLARELSMRTHRVDARAFVAWLDAQKKVVDPDRGIGSAGYCMGGTQVMRTAAAVADRVRAGAVFHGGGIATEAEDSPHVEVGRMQASFLFAIASNDDERDPAAKDRLREAFDAAGLEAEIEVYAGAMHGWCPPDSAVYDEAMAEKAWSRMLALYARALA